MSEYKSTTVIGEIKEHIRSKKIIIANPYGGNPMVHFMEESLQIMPNGTTLATPCKSELIEVFDDISKKFDILNPTDNTVIGESSYQELYILVYSLYIALAKKRDAEES